MTRAEEQRTREYREHLFKALSVAKLRLSNADFRHAAMGLEAEIRRIDEELSKRSFESYMGLQSELLPSWAFVGIAQRSSMILRQCSNVLFNSPTASSPWSSDVASRVNAESLKTTAPRLSVCAQPVCSS